MAYWRTGTRIILVFGTVGANASRGASGNRTFTVIHYHRKTSCLWLTRDLFV